jgi:membrane-associated phospholipid phosphatase/tRNA A-37 threonylcarbamoyl transferase component Bud32
LVIVFAATLLAGIVVSSLLRAGAATWLGAGTLRSLQDAMPEWLVKLCQRIDVIGGVAAVGVLRVATVLVLAGYKRWRHLVVFLATFVLTDWTSVRLLGVERVPPSGIVPMTDRATFWFPSRPVASFAVTLAGMAFVLVRAGGRRRLGLAAAVTLSIAYAGSRLVLAADYPLDAAYAALFGVTAAAAAFAAFVPDDVFPVLYRRGRPSAHLDLGGERGRAVVQAMAEQLDFTVTEVEPFGVKGSGGSSPLRMTVDELQGHLFAKIYSTNHLRADRWYRLGRTLLYGQLEDEVPFASVRRLVEYEDYALRLLSDIGVPVAQTYGIVELIPNREYMLVTEFFEDARTLDDAPVDDTVTDDGMALVRTFWDRGLAHRDIKPANLLVKDGHLQLVDVSGLEVRPTPWRQAVDLANMMLTLSLQSDPDSVFTRATKVFTPEEIAESFAADVAIAVPTQLRARLKADPRPIRRRFEELVPEHASVAIQRWSVRRTALLICTALTAVVLASMIVDSIMAGLA